MKKRYALLAVSLLLVAVSPLLTAADENFTCLSSDLIVKCAEDLIDTSDGYAVEFDCTERVEIEKVETFQCLSSDLTVTSDGEPIGTATGFPIGFPGEGPIAIDCCGGGHG